MVAGGIGVPPIVTVAPASAVPAVSRTNPLTRKLGTGVSAKFCVVVAPWVIVTLALELPKPNADAVAV